MLPSPTTTPATAANPQSQATPLNHDSNTSSTLNARPTRPARSSKKQARYSVSNLAVATWLGLGLAAGALIATVYFGVPMLKIALWTAANDFRDACWSDRDHGLSSAACDAALDHGVKLPPGSVLPRGDLESSAKVGFPFNATLAVNSSILRRSVGVCYSLAVHTKAFLHSSEQHKVTFMFAGGTHTLSAGTFGTIFAGLLAVLFSRHWLLRLRQFAGKVTVKAKPPAYQATEKQVTGDSEHPARSRTPWWLIEMASTVFVTGLILAVSLSVEGVGGTLGRCTGGISCLIGTLVLGLILAFIVITLTGDIRLAGRTSMMYVLIVALIDLSKWQGIAQSCQW